MVIGFNKDEKRACHPIENLYKGKYVIVTLQGAPATYAGKFERILKNFIILNPHQSRIVDEHGTLTFCMFEEPECLSLTNLLSIEPTTLENIINYNSTVRKSLKQTNSVKD